MAFKPVLVYFASLAASIYAAQTTGTCTPGFPPDGAFTQCIFPVGTGTLVKPKGANAVAFDIAGGQGGRSGDSYSGASARLQGTIIVDSLTDQEVVFTVVVGAAGMAGGSQNNAVGGSGYGNGGAGGTSLITTRPGAGGGSSAIIMGGIALVVVAGGGGSVISTINDVSPTSSSFSTTDNPGQSANGAAGIDALSGSGGGGGGHGGAGGSTASGSAGTFGGSYYDPNYTIPQAYLSTIATNSAPAADGGLVVYYATPIAPVPSGGSTRQRGRRLRRRNLCAPGHRICSRQSMVCIDLKNSFEHCGSCSNDCSDLERDSDRAKCVDGVCQSY